MRFSVLADFVCGFAVLDEIFFGFAVSSIPQCPPPRILAILRLTVIFFLLRLTEKLKINLLCLKELNINNPLFLFSNAIFQVLGPSWN